MMAAWQAAPGVKPDVLNRQVMAVEGLQQQRILYSLSFDRGLSWTEAAVVPTHDLLSESGQQEAETAQDMERPTIPQASLFPTHAPCPPCAIATRALWPMCCSKRASEGSGGCHPARGGFHM